MKPIGDLFNDLAAKADRVADGHFTVMKFTTNWRICFYTIDGREDIANMWVGDTFEDVARQALAANSGPIP